MSWPLQKIVHNEAMRTDPKEIYGWRVYALACSVSDTRGSGANWPFDLELIFEQACFGGMLFGMDSGIIGGVLTMPPFMA